MDKLTEIKELLLIMNKNIENLNEKLDIMSSKLDGEVIGECKKNEFAHKFCGRCV